MISIPTISQLYNAILADLEAEYSISIPIFGKNFLRAKAAVHAGKLKLFYLALGNIQKNIFIDTADPESKGGTLERFGRIKLGRNPFSAQAAQYEVTVTGTIGAVIKAQTTFKSNDDSLNPGQLFVLDNEFTLTAGTGSITIRALDAGLISSLNILDELTATAPIANVNSIVTVSAVAVQPLAAEDIEAYRTAGINAYRSEPQGGAATDYRLWAQDAQGVAKVYPYNKSGATSEINLFVEATIADSIGGQGVPGAAILAAVQSVVDFSPDITLDLNERGRRPMQVIVNYLPVVVKVVNINVAGFIGLTSAIQASILSAMKSSVSDIRPFIAGADVLAEKNSILDTNKIISVILTARPGAVFGAITLTIDGSPVSSYEFDNGEIPFLNSITYS